jgi:DNA invertase Pin-like site-specific DNA recombinase
MKLGYARVSTKHQSLEYQIENLKRAGCEKIFSDTITGYNKPKPQFIQMLSEAREGDVIVATTVCRLGRSSKDLFSLMDDFLEKGIGLYFISNPELDTRTANGRFFFQMNAIYAENERMRTIERVNLTLDARRARGRLGGRPCKLTEKQIIRMKELYDEKRMSLREICFMYSITKPTLYKYIRKIM